MNSAVNRPNVWPYVAIAAATKVAIGVLAYLYWLRIGTELPISSTPVTIISVGVALTIYTKHANFPMSRAQIILFGIGVALTDAVLSAALFIVPLWWVGESFSINNLDVMMGGDGTGLDQSDVLPLTLVMLFSLIVTFFLAAFFAWLITRRLPRVRSS